MPQPALSVVSAQLARHRMARRLGFGSVAAFEHWEDEIVIDHFANFICDYLALGYTVAPDKAGLVEFVDLERAVEERVQMLEDRRFEAVLDPDKSEWTARDHYKQFIVGVVADDLWLSRYGVEVAEICSRGWSAEQMTVKMTNLLEFLIQEWVNSPVSDQSPEKGGHVQVEVYRV